MLYCSMFAISVVLVLLIVPFGACKLRFENALRRSQRLSDNATAAIFDTVQAVPTAFAFVY